MKIYFEMLIWVLKDITASEHTGTEKCEIKSLRGTPPAGAFRENALYIINTDDAGAVKNFAATFEKQPRTAINAVLISERFNGSNEDIYPCVKFKDKDNYAFLIRRGTVQETVSLIEDAFFGFIEWERNFSECLLKNFSMETFLSYGKKYLHWQYFIFDRDLNSIFNSDEETFSTDEFSAFLDRKLFQALVLDKKFHDVRNKKGVFYYFNAETGKSICCNFTVKGEYMARLVMHLEEEETKIHPGAEEILEIFSEYIQGAFSDGKIALGHLSNDEAHNVLRSLAEGADTDERINFIFGGRWRENGRTFRVSVLRFYSDENWPAQLELTLPYLATKLEKEIPDSLCAATASEIVMLTGFEKDEGEEEKKFFGKLATFIRDNVCRAGISTQFEESAKLSGSVESARAALELGSVLKPHLWYYVFDDFRLEYMIRQCRQGLLGSLICHPAIEKLEKYDRKHGLELSKTLYVYLKNNLNMTAAANELFIHRTSFFHRVNRIKQLTGICLDNPDTALELLISYRIKGYHRDG